MAASTPPSPTPAIAPPGPHQFQHGLLTCPAPHDMIGVISLRDYCRLAAAHGVLDIDFDPGDTYAYVCTTPEGAPLANQDCGRIFSTPAAALRHWASRHHLDRDQLEAAVSLFPYPDLTRQLATGNTALSLIAFGYLEPNPSSPILAFPGARTAHETRSMCPHGCGTPITTTQARAKHYDAKQGSSGCRSAQELDGRGKTMADLGPPHSFWQKGFTQPSTVDWPAIPVSPDVQAVVTGRAPTAQEQWETMADRLCEQAEIAAPKLAPPDAPSNRLRTSVLHRQGFLRFPRLDDDPALRSTFLAWTSGKPAAQLVGDGVVALAMRLQAATRRWWRSTSCRITGCASQVRGALMAKAGDTSSKAAFTAYQLAASDDRGADMLAALLVFAYLISRDTPSAAGLRGVFPDLDRHQVRTAVAPLEAYADADIDAEDAGLDVLLPSLLADLFLCHLPGPMAAFSSITLVFHFARALRPVEAGRLAQGSDARGFAGLDAIASTASFLLQGARMVVFWAAEERRAEEERRSGGKRPLLAWRDQLDATLGGADAKDLAAHVREIMQVFWHDGHPSVLEELHARRNVFRLAFQTHATVPRASVGLDGSVILDGVRITHDRLDSALAALLRRADDALFGEDGIFAGIIDRAELESILAGAPRVDQPQQTAIGYTMAHARGLETLGTRLLGKLVRSPTARARFFDLAAGAMTLDTDFGRRAARALARQVATFASHSLLPLVHVTSGSPARITESIHLRFACGDEDRNIYLLGGQVTLIFKYGKMSSKRGRDIAIARSPAPAVAWLVDAAVAAVFPLLSTVLRLAGLPDLAGRFARGYLYPTGDGSPLEARAALRAVASALGAVDLPLNVSGFRQLAAIRIRPLDADLARQVLGGGEGEDDDDDDGGSGLEAMERGARSSNGDRVTTMGEVQAGHAGRTVDVSYGVAATSHATFSPERVLAFQRTSRAVSAAIFPSLAVENSAGERPRDTGALILDTVRNEIGRQFAALPAVLGLGRPVAKLAPSLPSTSPAPTAARPALSPTNITEPITEREFGRALEVMQTFLAACAPSPADGTPRSPFRSFEQARGLALALRHGSRRHALIVTGTGTGKTILSTLPGLVAPAAGAIDALLLPYVALRLALSPRVREWAKRLGGSVWTCGDGGRWPTSGVVITGIGAMATRIKGQQSLDGIRRLTFDEAHVLLTEADFRADLQLVARECLARAVPMTFTSATFGLHFDSALCDALGLDLCQLDVIRAADTSRRDLRYHVRQLPAGAALVAEAKAYMALHPLRRGLKDLVILENRAAVEAAVADDPAALCLHGAMTPSQRRSVLDAYASDPAVTALFGTSAIEAGVDLGCIARVHHLAPPSRLSSWLQGGGRASRDGAGGTVILWTTVGARPRPTPTADTIAGAATRLDESAMATLVASAACLRSLIGAWADADDRPCAARPGAVLCGRCAPRGAGERDAGEVEPAAAPPEETATGLASGPSTRATTTGAAATTEAGPAPSGAPTGSASVSPNAAGPRSAASALPPPAKRRRLDTDPVGPGPSVHPSVTATAHRLESLRHHRRGALDRLNLVLVDLAARHACLACHVAGVEHHRQPCVLTEPLGIARTLSFPSFAAALDAPSACATCRAPPHGESDHLLPAGAVDAVVYGILHVFGKQASSATSAALAPLFPPTQTYPATASFKNRLDFLAGSETASHVVRAVRVAAWAVARGDPGRANLLDFGSG